MFPTYPLILKSSGRAWRSFWFLCLLALVPAACTRARISHSLQQREWERENSEFRVCTACGYVCVRLLGATISRPLSVLSCPCMQVPTGLSFWISFVLGMSCVSHLLKTCACCALSRTTRNAEAVSRVAQGRRQTPKVSNEGERRRGLWAGTGREALE